MVTFVKVINILPPLTKRNFTKLQNKKLLPVVKQLASDSMVVNNATTVKEVCGNEAGECSILLHGTWQ